MLLDEIQEAYFKNEYADVMGAKLEISFDTYKKMLLQDYRVVTLGRPNNDGELPPMFGRPVTIVHDSDRDWAWVYPQK